MMTFTFRSSSYLLYEVTKWNIGKVGRYGAKGRQDINRGRGMGMGGG
jgi:hypothetical protein